MKTILCVLFLITSFSSFANSKDCFLDPQRDYPYSTVVLHSFEGVDKQTQESASSIKEYESLPLKIKELIYESRTQSESTSDFYSNNPSSEELVSGMDYLKIVQIELMDPINGNHEFVFLVDIAVGGGNGAFMFMKEVEGQYTKIYEDFDGETIFCDPEYSDY